MFFQLLKVATGRLSQLSETPTAEEWTALFDMAQKQAVLGVCFTAVERLPEEQRPPKSMLLQWYSIVAKIEERNRLMNRQCVAVSRRFLADKFRSCVLKGQGVARYYDQPLRRQSGDIDIWLEGGRKKIVEYVHRITPESAVRYHHVDFPAVKGLEIEAHFMPSWMFNPFTNRRLQKWFAAQAPVQFAHFAVFPDGQVPVPTHQFDLIYLLIHIYRHLFDEGIGLRQLMDYYYLLQRVQTSEVRNETVATLGRFRMKRFASAVMWLLKEVFGLEEAKMYIQPNEADGRFLLEEVLLAGNFGQYDERSKSREGESLLHLFVRKQVRSLRFLSSYPQEIFWNPLFTIAQRVWRIANHYA